VRVTVSCGVVGPSCSHGLSLCGDCDALDHVAYGDGLNDVHPPGHVAKGGVRTVQEGDNTVVVLSGAAPDPVDSVVVLDILGAPHVPPRTVAQRPDGRIRLQARVADLHGTKAHYEFDEKTGKDNIGYWVDPRDWVSWLMDVKNPGTFQVRIIYACPNGTAGSTFDLGIGPGHLKGTVAGTGSSWSDFREFNAGRVILPRPGRYPVTVKPVEMPGFAVMNLKAIELIPE